MDEIRSLLDKLVALNSELDQLKRRYDKIEEKKSDVRPEVYRKLREEYAGKLQQAEIALGPEQALLKEKLGSLQSSQTLLKSELDEIEKRVEELELRRFIGEFENDKSYQSRVNEESEGRKRIESQLETLEELLKHGEKLLGDLPVVAPGSSPAEKTRPNIGSGLTDTQPIATPAKTRPSSDSKTKTKNQSAAASIEDTLDMKRGAELAATVASPNAENQMPVFDDPMALETSNRTSPGRTDPGAAVPDAHLEIVFKDETKTMPVPGFPFTIGRSKKNALTLKSEEISRYHAQIQFENGKFWVEDLGSANGTKLDGKRIQRAELKTGGQIALGPADIQFRID